MAKAKGGKREGAGRKPGKALKLTDYLKQTDVHTFMEFLLANYMEDSRLMVWMGDHIFGKAPQPLTGAEGKDLFPAPLYGGKSLPSKRHDGNARNL